MIAYVFILCPPYCGSTLLWRLLATSDAVGVLPGEGQFLPETRAWMRDRPWDAQTQMPWPEIRSIWERHWGDADYKLEKSPPNLLRADAIEEHFAPARFLLMVRDPYAHCEGLMRRNGWSATVAARFALRCLRLQRRNQRRLSAVHSLRYENLVADAARECSRIERFLPGIGPLDPAGRFATQSLDGPVDAPIHDLNARKLSRLFPGQFAAINSVFAPHESLLAHFGYALREPAQDQQQRALAAHAVGWLGAPQRWWRRLRRRLQSGGGVASS